MLSIIVLCYNRLDFTKQTIKALMEKTTVKSEFIFVDNASTDGTKNYLKSLKHKTGAVREILVFNKFNQGISIGRNKGIVQSRGDFILTLDNDIIVPENYDKLLIEACNKIKNLGMVGISVEKPDYDIITQNGVSIQYKKNNIGGAAICLRREIFNRIGYFHADHLYGAEDCNYYIRMQYLGLINGYIIPKGIHLGLEDSKQEYKLLAHSADSYQVKKLAETVAKYVKRGSAYEPYAEPRKINKDGSFVW